MQIKDEKARRFYEIETLSQQWSIRQLQRQYNSSLYERLALSRDKDEVMRLALAGQTIEKPRYMLKNPLVLEFLDLEQNPVYSESDLESAIIANLQKFFLSLEKGFFLRRGRNVLHLIKSRFMSTSFFTIAFCNATFLLI
jgi:predicted nuclease of restriction endonuclease-like (RecB) superfamily